MNISERSLLAINLFARSAFLLLRILLINFHSEQRGKGIDGIHDVGKLMLILNPCLFFQEKIELDGQARVGGLQLPDHERHVLVDVGQRAQIFLHVTAEQTDVYRWTCIKLLGREKLVVEELLAKRGVEGAYAVEIEKHHALNPSATALLHALPVLERLLHKRRRRHGDEGVVEVAHLDRGERHLLNHTVHASLVEGYPVALVKHVVARQAHASHKAGDGILEHKHHDGRGGTQSG